MAEGWIKLHRKFDEWQWLNKPEMVSLFVYCLIKANHNGAYWQNEKIERGQFITSPEKLSVKLGISYQSIRTCLTRLEKTGEIIKKSTNKYTIITVCNYDGYQMEQQSTNKQLTNKQQSTNKQLTTNKNNKNDKNNILDKSNIFYQSEIEKSQNNVEYVKFVKVLFGENNLKQPLTNVLKLKNQLTFEQFPLVMAKRKEYNSSITSTLENMENKPNLSKNYISLQRTLLNWMKPKELRK